MSYSKYLGIALSLGLLGATACSDDGGEATPGSGKDSSVPNFTNDAEAPEKDGGNSSVEDDADVDGGTPDDGDGGGTIDNPDGGEPINCDDPSGCYACPPSTNLQFLNACVDPARGITQRTFDNARRIPDFDPNDPFPAL